jgi:hypothetical protein
MSRAYWERNPDQVGLSKDKFKFLGEEAEDKPGEGASRTKIDVILLGKSVGLGRLPSYAA